MYKTGKCKDCSYIGKLIAGRCSSHYWEYRAKLSVKKKNESRKDDKSEQDTLELKDWFNDMIKIAPKHCEECGCNLAANIRIMPKEVIAHIWPKRQNYGYPSVSTHPLNRMFFCIDCHTNFDNKGKDYILKMKSFNEIHRRSKLVYEDMTSDEQNRANLHFEYLT